MYVVGATFNRTSLELKHVKPQEMILRGFAFNRTSLELKQYYRGLPHIDVSDF